MDADYYLAGASDYLERAEFFKLPSVRLTLADMEREFQKANRRTARQRKQTKRQQTFRF